MQLLYLWIAIVALGAILTAIKRTRIAGKVLLTLTLITAILPMTFMLWLSLVFSNAAVIYIVVLFAYAILTAVLGIFIIWGSIRKKRVYLPILAGLIVTTLTWGGYAAYEHYDRNIPTLGDGDVDFYTYAPYSTNSKVVVLHEESTLKLTEDLPRLDGATALFPVYSAFARAVYPKEILDNDRGLVEYLNCSKTAEAYRRLVDGEVDMIFVASASEQQTAYAKEKGAELTFTPIVREAFVFFVNTGNPVNSLTVEQVQQIYSGEVTDWRALGANLGNIRAFQRDEGSGSQTALQKLMEGKTLLTPPQEDIATGMGGIIKRTADYKNYKNAIGYSFRFYCTQMVKNNQIKLLKLNGVAPTKENVSNGTYPVASEFYAVTTQNSNPNSEKLLDWICSEQGQRIVDETGYVAVK